MGKNTRQEPRQLQGHDERNIARLALALAQNRIPSTLQSWEKRLTVDALGAIHVKCVSRADAVVPHGLDNDIIIGLVNAFVEQGLPNAGVIQLSAYRLLTLAGLTVGGRQYGEVLEGLRRLQGSTFAITESWFDGRQHQWISEEFSIISSFARVDATEVAEEIGLLRADTILEIQLARAITRSVRSGHLRPLDLEFYSKLSQPMVRTLYRSLEERRAPLGKVATDAYTVSTRNWGEHLGMHGWRLDKIRRALEPAHQELLDTAYLIEVIYTGRGEGQQITYRFGQVAAPPNTELVALLTRNGLSAPNAVKTVQEYAAQVEPTVAAFGRVVRQARTPVKNRQGLLVDMFRNPERYAEYFLPATADHTPADEFPKKTRPKTATVDAPAADDDWEAQQALAWREMRPEARERRMLGLLQMMLGEYLSSEEMAGIATLAGNGTLDGLDFSRRMTRAVADNAQEVLAAEFRVLVEQ
ncbi:replication initiator protein A [Deinococcus petrolearius]|uniref:Replication initiator protein A n=1 Tax=Deinococcus petrolearius TaxID=1751295 RepID=A0ABW1DM12_9DEIO